MIKFYFNLGEQKLFLTEKKLKNNEKKDYITSFKKSL